jgi:hypothetical protein
MSPGLRTDAKHVPNLIVSSLDLEVTCIFFIKNEQMTAS